MSTTPGAARTPGHRRWHRGGHGDAAARHDGRDRTSVVGRERATYGGIKLGSAFFGWLTATGTAVLLTALAAGAGAVVALASGNNATGNTATMGVTGVIVLLVVLFVSYYCGGYVAGRMARFNGLTQGLFVWLWAVAIAVVVAIVAAVAGNKFDILGRLNSFPRLPFNEGNLTAVGVLAVVVAAAAALAGALLGGLAGMHFHRKVDRAGFDTAPRDAASPGEEASP
ncbi:hypothetical protein [Specibacter cremeus]|uniref:hypothetical protein n=1 Tax=Specibacter cremeus TaxID=1629051 RepID=UPI00197C6095|nr:hypothetical protein [Specibacter cremeus]